jgi:hypothetical protein
MTLRRQLAAAVSMPPPSERWRLSKRERRLATNRNRSQPARNRSQPARKPPDVLRLSLCLRHPRISLAPGDVARVAASVPPGSCGGHRRRFQHPTSRPAMTPLSAREATAAAAPATAPAAAPGSVAPSRAARGGTGVSPPHAARARDTGPSRPPSRARRRASGQRSRRGDALALAAAAAVGRDQPSATTTAPSGSLHDKPTSRTGRPARGDALGAVIS